MSARPQSQQQRQQQEQEAPFQSEKEEEYSGKIIKFTEDEVVYIENILVTLREAIPNDMGENSEILEKIVTAEQIITARLDSGEEAGDSIGMGNSGGSGQG
jgi:hypothetical protein